jgi:hypothetical protein
MKTYPGAMEVYLAVREACPRVMEVHPGVVNDS